MEIIFYGILAIGALVFFMLFVVPLFAFAVFFYYLAIPLLGALLGGWIGFIFGIGLAVVVAAIVETIKAIRTGPDKVPEAAAKLHYSDEYLGAAKEGIELDALLAKSLKEDPITLPPHAKRNIAAFWMFGFAAFGIFSKLLFEYGVFRTGYELLPVAKTALEYFANSAYLSFLLSIFFLSPDEVGKWHSLRTRLILERRESLRPAKSKAAS